MPGSVGAGCEHRPLPLPFAHACFHAARAALSEEDLYAPTHDGIWWLFFHPEGREGVHDHARKVEPEAAREAVMVADRFLAAVRALFA